MPHCFSVVFRKSQEVRGLSEKSFCKVLKKLLEAIYPKLILELKKEKKPRFDDE